jgi:hypothetical protein
MRVRQWMEASGQLHTTAALPQGRNPWYPLDRRLGGPQSRSGRWWREKFPAPAGTRSPDHPSSNPGFLFLNFMLFKSVTKQSSIFLKCRPMFMLNRCAPNTFGETVTLWVTFAYVRYLLRVSASLPAIPRFYQIYLSLSGQMMGLYHQTRHDCLPGNSCLLNTIISLSHLTLYNLCSWNSFVK